MVVPAPVGAAGPEPGAAVPGTQTDSGPHRLDGEDLHAGQTGGVSRKISSSGGVPPSATRWDTTTPTATNLAHATRNISDRAAKRILQRRGRGGWAVVGGIHLRGGAVTALAPSQVQSKDGENVENVLLLIFFSTFAQCGKRSALLNGRPTDLFFTLYSLHAQSCQVLPHQHLTAMQPDVTNKISESETLTLVFVFCFFTSQQ